MIRKKEWLEIFDRWEASGLSQAAFCRKNGINLKSFYSKKSKYKNCRKQTGTTGSFIEVTQQAASFKPATPMTFNVQLPDGVTLVFPLSADPQSIAGIIVALRSR